MLFNSSLAYLLNHAVKSPHCVAGPSSLIGASNYFELAVATAIALFGFESGAALATVGWYEQPEGIQSYDECCPSR